MGILDTPTGLGCMFTKCIRALMHIHYGGERFGRAGGVVGVEEEVYHTVNVVVARLEGLGSSDSAAWTGQKLWSVNCFLYLLLRKSPTEV